MGHTTEDNSVLLSVRELEILVPERKLRIVEDVTLDIAPGERLGVVGESGSGKTMTAMAILGLTPTTTEIRGTIEFAGSDLRTVSSQRLREIRGNEIAMVFQDPLSVLNPVFSVGTQIRNVLRAHQKVSKAAAKRRVLDLMGQAGIPNPAGRYDDYPHQLSGGLRQRCMIAAALICEPRLLIADEPTSALDPTIQAQIIALLDHLANERSMAILLISHDIPLVSSLCQRIVTMYAGQVVDISNASELSDLSVVRHPYTEALLRCAPSLDDGATDADFDAIPGQPPSVGSRPAGCRFHPRCHMALPPCERNPQVLVPLSRGRAARCWRVTDAVPKPGHVPKPSASAS